MRHTKPPSATVLMEGWMVHYTNKSTLVMKGGRGGREGGREGKREGERQRERVKKNTTFYLFILFYFRERNIFGD